MEVKLAVLADFASIAINGKLNIMGIFDEVNPAQLPFALPIFYVVTSFGTHASEFDAQKTIETVLNDEDGAVLARLSQEIIIPRPGRPGMRGTVNKVHGLVGLPFKHPGDYEFAILENGRPIGHIQLRVNAPPEYEVDAASN